MGLLASATSSLSTALAGAPSWAVVLVALAVPLLFLASLHMTYRAMYRIASLSQTGTFKGPWGVKWKSTPEPESPESASRGSPRLPP